jgi:hypothetical protein
MRQRQPRKKDNKHLNFIRGLPCCVCLNNIETEAAHVRMADPRAAKRYVGKGEKADDRWTLPLCSYCHSFQHATGESRFWCEHVPSLVPTQLSNEIDPIFLALALHSVSGDHAAGEEIIRAYH